MRVRRPVGYFRVCSLAEGGCVAWMLRLVKIGVEGEGPCTDIMEIHRPDDLVDIANLGLTLAEAKRLLAGVQREIVAVQARDHAVRRPSCACCGDVCRVKDYRNHAVSTLFGPVTLRLPQFRCAACGGIEAGIDWPAHCRSTPELDRLQAHLCALMTDRTAADVLAQMFPVAAGAHHATLRRHALKVGEALGDHVATRSETAASAIVVTLDSTFIRSCAEGERHLEVRVGNVETPSGGRQVFGAVAKSGTDLEELIRRSLDAVGRTGDTALTAFTDGCPGLRRILADAGVTTPPMLDWFRATWGLSGFTPPASPQGSMMEYPVREPCPPKCCYPDMQRSNPTCEAPGTTATIWKHRSGGGPAEDGRLNASERPWLRSVIENRPKVLTGRSQNGARVGSSSGTLDDGGNTTRRTIGRSRPIRISILDNRVSPTRPVAARRRYPDRKEGHGGGGRGTAEQAKAVL